jgi:hypothetical protein
MRKRKISVVPASLSRLEQRFAAWREERVAGQRIPESLWNSAVKVARQHGVSRTASHLKLDYHTLKKRVEDASSLGASSPFVELPPVPVSTVSECVIEWEDVAGARMRVQLTGQSPPDLVALSRDFWGAD